MSRPTFTPASGPLACFIAFVLTPGAGWGADLAAIQGSDFDDVLESIPPDVVAWHIFDTSTGYIIAGSDPVVDRKHQGTPSEPGESPPAPREPVAPFLIFSKREDAWGAWCITHSTDNPLDAVDQEQVIHADSTVFSRGRPENRVIPTLEQMEAFEEVIAEWQMEEEALGRPQEVDPAVEARAQVFMAEATLPEGWTDLPTEQLREVVEAAEKAVLLATGKTPDEIRVEREETKRALSDVIEETQSEPTV